MRKRVLAGIAAVAAGILIGMPVCAQEEPISDGVFIGDKNVGGMMPDEAAQYVKNEVATLGSTTVTITMGSQQTSATFRELGFSWENTDLVDEINAHSHNALYLPTFQDIKEYLLKNWQSGDIVVTLGSGDVYKQQMVLLEK